MLGCDNWKLWILKFYGNLRLQYKDSLCASSDGFLSLKLFLDTSEFGALLCFWAPVIEDYLTDTVVDKDFPDF